MLEDGDPPPHLAGPQGSADSDRSRQEREDALRRLAHGIAADPTTKAPVAGPADPAAPPSVWRTHLTAGVTARQRRWQLLALVSSVLVVAVVVGALALHGAVGLPLPGISGAPSLLPGQVNRVYLDSDVPWATVTLDGRPITPPIIGKQAPLTLSPGAHTIRWTAEPFDPQVCQLSIPASRDDTCQLSTTQVVTLPHQPTAQLVYLGESLTTLSTTQQAALKQAIQAALPSYVTTAQPGEMYFTPSHVANEPLRMALSATLNADASGFTTGDCFSPLMQDYLSCDLDGRNCVRLCTLPYSSHALLPAPDPHAWYAFTLTLLTWSVSAPDGRVITQWTTQSAVPGQTPIGGVPVLLRMRWTGTQWSVRQVVGAALPRQLVLNDGLPIPDDPACYDAIYMLVGAIYPVTPNDYLGSYSQMRFISGPNPAVGCLVEATAGIPGKPPAKGAPVAEYLDRFGMVYELTSVDAPNLMPPGLTNQPSAIQQQVAHSLSAYPGQLYVLPADVGTGQQ